MEFEEMKELADRLCQEFETDCDVSDSEACPAEPETLFAEDAPTVEELAAEEWEILKQVDRKVLRLTIEQLFAYRVVEWSESRTEVNEKGEELTFFSYPVYPEWLSDALELMDVDADYETKLRDIEEGGLQPSDLNAAQLQAVLYSLRMEEKHSDGVIAEAVESGRLIRLLMRLDDLINRYKLG